MEARRHEGTKAQGHEGEKREAGGGKGSRKENWPGGQFHESNRNRALTQEYIWVSIGFSTDRGLTLGLAGRPSSFRNRRTGVGCRWKAGFATETRVPWRVWSGWGATSAGSASRACSEGPGPVAPWWAGGNRGEPRWAARVAGWGRTASRARAEPTASVQAAGAARGRRLKAQKWACRWAGCSGAG